MNAYTRDFNQTLIALRLWGLAQKFRKDKEKLHAVAKQYRQELIRYQMCK